MNPSVPYRIAHCFCGLVADTGSEVYKKLTIAILGSPWTKGITQKVKLDFRIISPAIIVFKIYDPRFVWMQLKAAFIETHVQSLK